MAYYHRTDRDGRSQGVWEITPDQAIRVGIVNARESPGCFFQANEGENIFDAIRRQAEAWFLPDGQSPFHESELPPGFYYPRMARPHDQHLQESPGHSPSAYLERDAVLKSRSQITLLARLLGDIFQTVHPSHENMGVHGNNIRNLLVLAAMEVEAQWKGILRANNVEADRTTDYVKLLPAMRLDEYSVSLSEFPWIAPIRPFAGWDRLRPTASLSWYAAYNATKHDRETSFAEATLGRAIAAVCANVILLAAQYSIPSGLGQGSRLSEEFIISTAPSWTPGQAYIYPYGNDLPNFQNWNSTNFPFRENAVVNCVDEKGRG